MKARPLLAWLLLAAVSVGLFVWAFPRTFPWLPERWTVSKRQAIAVALERLRDLGAPVAGGYVDARLDYADELGRCVWRVEKERLLAPADRERLRPQLLVWEVRVFERTAHASEWTYRARIAPGGEIVALQLRLDPEAEAGMLDDAAARARADEFLREQGFDLGEYEAPEARSQQLESRTDRRLLYRLKGRPLGAEIAYGVEVGFAGDRLTGYLPWVEDPRRAEFGRLVNLLVLGNLGWRILPFLILPVVTIFFVRRYHEGEIGVRRGVQIAGLAIGLALVATLLSANAMGIGTDFGPTLTRPQITWVVALLIFFTYFAPVAVLSALGWSVGEVLCRDRAPGRLAAFDALFKGDWANATVARASLRGVAAGLFLAAAQIVSLLLVSRMGAFVSHGNLFGPWWDGATWFGFAMLAFVAFHLLYSELFGRLLLTSALVRRLGSWAGGALAALIGALIFFPPVVALPMRFCLPIWLAVAAVQVFLFLRYGLATSLLAALTSAMLVSSYAFLISGHPGLQLQASLPLLVVGLPFLVSLRHLASEREFVYRWDDVPPHVRRIAERERQRVELETARRIQSSILPELPPQLNGVALAHAYLPATEVGGDFYDVLALEDGRLAVAVGDVAGHGVSSGLVMSMARSALAVQVTFNPEVQAVFSTLNRVVYQSARKRLLATLCYAVLDPRRRELLYASAGHLYPYLVTAEGKVRPLEFVAYPLGVRDDLKVEARLARLDSGDTLFLLSDGLIEARQEGSEELFGFERLEESLARHAHLGVDRLRDAVLADVARHTRGAPREDDQTVLVLRVP
jgi:hypothetical protein